MKLVFEKASGEILGGQIYGGSTVGEVVNILAVLIQKRMKADEIVTFQLGTQPAFTPSPIVYPLVSAAEAAAVKL